MYITLESAVIVEAVILPGVLIAVYDVITAPLLLAGCVYCIAARVLLVAVATNSVGAIETSVNVFIIDDAVVLVPISLIAYAVNV